MDKKEICNLAEKILTGGLSEEVKNDLEQQEIAFEEIGDVTTFYKSEIESYVFLKSLIKAYLEKEDIGRPLCITVFGSPGNGKSFGVEQIIMSIIAEQILSKYKDTEAVPTLEKLKKKAKEIIGDMKIDFNMSQYTKEDDYYKAMKKIFNHKYKMIESKKRNALFCFFDEFDTSFNGADLWWLQKFIMPMWDGKFFDKYLKIKKFEKKCIFVFAGGKYDKFQEFEEEVNSRFKKTEKGTDFISRLSGKLDIESINYEKDSSSHTIFQRAILIYNLIGKHAGSQKREEILEESVTNKNYRNLLNALLYHVKFNYGVRSIELIIQSWIYNSLKSPDDSILAIHVHNKAHFKNIARGYLDIDQIFSKIQVYY